MAEIPQYQRRAPASGNDWTPRLGGIPNDPGFGNALAEAGEAATRVAGMSAQAYVQNKERDARKMKEQQEKFDSQQALRVFSEFQIADQQRQYNYQNQYSGDLTKYAASDREDRNKFYEGYVTEPITPGAQEKLNGMYGQYNVQQSGQALDFQAKSLGLQVRRNVEVAANNFINDTRTNAYTNFWTNQQKLDELAETFKGQLPEEAIKGLISDYKDRNAIAMIRGKADKNPRQTLQELDNHVYDKLLTPDALETTMTGLRREIEAEDKQLQAHYASEVASKMDDHFASMMETNTPVIVQGDIDKIADPLMKAEVQEEYNLRTKVAKKYFQTIKGSEGIPLDQQLAKLDSLKPKPGSDHFAEEKQMYDMLHEAVIQQNKMYNEDKFASSMQNAQVAAAWNRSPVEGRRASLTYQMNKGTPWHKLQVASNDEVAQTGDQLNQLIQANKFDEAKMLMGQLKSDYNVMTMPDGRTGWDVFKAQLQRSKEGKVPDDFLMALQYQDIPQGNEIFQAYKVTKTDYTTLIGDQNIKTVDAGVLKAVQQYNAVLQKIPGFAGSTALANKSTLASKYAYRLVQQGMDPNAAAQQAYKTMYQYDVINNTRQNLIIPKKIGDKAINSGTVQSALTQLSNVDLIYSYLSKNIPQGQANQKVTLTKLSVKDNYGNHKGGDVFLNAPAASAFERAQAAMKNAGVASGILVNSGYRTRGEQQAAYNLSIKGGPTAAKPGGSTHEMEGGAKGLDVENYTAARPFLEANGFAYRPHKNDPFHFEYVGGGTGTYTSGVPERIGDPAKRKRYADALAKQGIWKVSGDLRSAILYSKNTDGSMTPVYDANHKPYQFSFIDLQAGSYDKKAAYLVNDRPKSNLNDKGYSEYLKRKEKRITDYVKMASKTAGKEIFGLDEANFVMERGF